SYRARQRPSCRACRAPTARSRRCVRRSLCASLTRRPKYRAVAGRSCVRPTAEPAVTSPRPELSTKIIASTSDGLKPLPRAARTTSRCHCATRTAVATTPPGLASKSPRSNACAASPPSAAATCASAAADRAFAIRAGPPRFVPCVAAGAAAAPWECACGRRALTPSASSASPTSKTSTCSARSGPRERGRRATISVNVDPFLPDLGARQGRRHAGRRQSPFWGTRRLRGGIDLRSLQTSRVVDVDRLPLGEDVEGGLPGLAVPVARVLRAAEREMHLGAGRAGVDVRDARLQIAHRAERRVDVLREDRRREAVADAVRDADRLVGVGDLDERRRRAEDLLLRDPHL